MNYLTFLYQNILHEILSLIILVIHIYQKYKYIYLLNSYLLCFQHLFRASFSRQIYEEKKKKLKKFPYKNFLKSSVHWVKPICAHRINSRINI